MSLWQSLRLLYSSFTRSHFIYLLISFFGFRVEGAKKNIQSNNWFLLSDCLDLKDIGFEWNECACRHYRPFTAEHFYLVLFLCLHLFSVVLFRTERRKRKTFKHWKIHVNCKTLYAANMTLYRKSNRTIKLWLLSFKCIFSFSLHVFACVNLN